MGRRPSDLTTAAKSPIPTLMPTLPPPLEKLYNTPVLRSEMPAGFDRAKVVRLAPDQRIHTLGAIRIDFSNARASESVSYALFKDVAHASVIARTERAVNTSGLFRVRVAVVGRLVVGVAASTGAQAKTLLDLALAHLRRSEKS
jgi:hypothetical protein